MHSFIVIIFVVLLLGNSDRTTQFVRSSFSYIKPPQIISFNINKPRTNLTRNITTISTKPTITSTEPVASTEPPETSLPLINPKDLNESGIYIYICNGQVDTIWLNKIANGCCKITLPKLTIKLRK